MSSRAPGAGTSLSEVSAINQHGFWLLVDDREYFVSFRDYPAFRQASVAQIFLFQRLSPDQFYWQELDIDIELESLQRPERFSLTYR